MAKRKKTDEEKVIDFIGTIVLGLIFLALFEWDYSFLIFALIIIVISIIISTSISRSENKLERKKDKIKKEVYMDYRNSVISIIKEHLKTLARKKNYFNKF